MSVMRNSHSQVYHLRRPTFTSPHLETRRHSAAANHIAKHLPRNSHPRAPTDPESITPAALASYIKNPSQLRYNQLTIIDCRYPFEFNSGRIVGAVNVQTKQQMDAMQHQFRSPNTLFVFYSQDSKERAPMVCSMFKEALREVAGCQFAVLEGGMKDFSSSYSFLCIGHYKPKLCLSESMLELIKARRQFRYGFKPKTPAQPKNGKIQFVLDFSNAK